MGKKKLEIATFKDPIEFNDADWAASFNTFSSMIGANLNEKRHSELMKSNFSTTGKLESAVTNICLMDTMQEYFEYSFNCVCGIPFIELGGDFNDWTKLKEKAQILLPEFDLGYWSEHLLPLLDQFINASKGSIDKLFWANIAQKRWSENLEFCG